MKSDSRITLVGLVLAVVFFGSAFPVSADELAQSGRAIAGRIMNSLVTVRIVSKVRAEFMDENESREIKQEVTGVVVDPSGLVVTSLAGTDVTGIYASMMGSGENAPQVSSSVTSAKIMLSDGREIAARVVLRDKDLDLAFIRPAEKLKDPMPAVDMSNTSIPQLLDQVLVINRLGSTANRAVSVREDRISAVIEKPRTFYVLMDSQSPSLGSPVFATDGKIIGMMLLRTKPSGAAGSWLEMSGSGPTGLLGIILPASDIAEAAKQAPDVSAVKEPAPTPTPAPKRAPAAPKKPAPTPATGKPGSN